MKKLLKVLKFFRITDENDLLSLSHMAIYLVMIKLAMADAVNLQDAALAAAALMNYAHKRHAKGK